MLRTFWGIIRNFVGKIPLKCVYLLHCATFTHERSDGVEDEIPMGRYAEHDINLPGSVLEQTVKEVFLRVLEYRCICASTFMICSYLI